MELLAPTTGAYARVWRFHAARHRRRRLRAGIGCTLTLLLALAPTSHAHAVCNDNSAAGGAAIVCAADDNNGFSSNFIPPAGTPAAADVASITVQAGVTVDDSASAPAGSGAQGGSSLAVIEVFRPGPDVADVIGDFTNNGTISDTRPTDAAFLAEGMVGGNIVNTGTIFAQGRGVDIDGAVTGSIVNSGSISGGSGGVDVEGTVGSFSNQSDARISAGGIGVEIGGVLTGGFTNAGSISGTILGIQSTGAINGGFVNSGLIGGVGATDVSGGFNNTGSIIGFIAGVSAVNISGGFDNTGSIQGGQAGVTVSNGLTGAFTNSGSISSSRDEGVEIDSVAGSFSNTGSITGLTIGVTADDISGDFNNSGMIGGLFDGVFIGNAVTGAFINSGSISASFGQGVDVNGAVGSFSNASGAMITGTDDGVDISGAIAGGFENEGAITGDSDGNGDGDGVEITASAGNSSAFSNSMGGTISGAVGFDAGDGVELLTNAGTITGSQGTAVNLGGGNDSLTLSSGSVLNGSARGGSGTDALVVSGSVIEDSDLIEFETFIFNGSGAESSTLAGTVDSTTNSINSGTLLANGMFGTATGTTTIASSASLGGTGTVLGTVSSAGTISPGTSIGTLTIGGSFSQSPGSVLNMELGAGGTSDRLVVGGTAELNGSLVISLDTGVTMTDILNTNFTLVDAGSSVTGTLATAPNFGPGGNVTTPSFGLITPSFTLSVIGTDLVLGVAASSQFSSLGGLTPNQSATAGGIDTGVMAAGATARFSNAATALSLLNTAAIPAVLDTLHPEFYDAFSAAQLDMSDDFRNVMGDRLVTRRRDCLAPRRVAVSGTTDAQCGEQASTQRVWGELSGGFQDRDGELGHISYDTHRYAFTFGYDLAVNDNLIVGVAAGYGHANVDVSGLGDGDVDAAHVGLYASYQVEQITFDATLAGSYFWNDSSRSFGFTSAGGTFANTVSGDFSSGTVSGRLLASYHISAGDFGVRPFVGMDFSNISGESFTESGDADLGLRVDRVSETDVVGKLGVELSRRIGIGNTRSLGAHTRFTYEHTLADADRSIRGAFRGAGPASTFTVEGDADENRLRIDAGLSGSVSDALELELTYAGMFSENDDAHGVQLSAVVRFD